MSLANKLAEERRARLAAERLLELKQAELSAANRKLGRHALALTRQIGETQAEVATVRDENEKVKSDLHVANEKIQIAERRLWLSIQSIQDGFAFFDADGLMIGANTAYITAFDGLEEVVPGISYTRILQLLTDEGLVNTEDLSPGQWRAMMSERWMSPAPKPIVIRWWNDQYLKFFDQRGHGGDVVSLGLNITASVRYEEELKTAREKAEAASRAKSAFLANMSHEIRTPMNGVVGMADLLCDTKLSEEQRLYANTIRNSGEALLVIINDVLDYSKIEADKLVLHEEIFDLEHCIHDVIMLLQPTAREKGISLLVDYDIFLPTRFVGDPGRIRQVLTNLTGNAVKFTKTGHVILRVTGVPDPQNGACDIHLTIEDTGIGIAEDMVDHVFGEFNQVDDAQSRKFEGTGLGLAITRRLIEMMNGSVWVESTLGKGSCFGFQVRLPRAEGVQPEPPAIPDRLKSAVVIGDTAVSRDLIEKQLVQLGIEVTSCPSTIAGLNAITRDTGFLACDHNMPEMDGLELVQALREDRGWHGPFILMTDNPGGAQNDPAFRHVHSLLQKPYPRSDLFARLTDLAKSEDPQGVGDDRAVAAPAPGIGQPAQPDRDGPVPEQTEDRPRLMRVLAAEDNKTNQLVFRKMVKSLAIELKFANNGHEAVQAFKDFQPDLIFMDISMPGMDGKEATREIRNLESETGGHVPIVALTAHALEGDSEAILSAGLDHFMTKPLRKAALYERIAELCPEETQYPLPEPRDQAS